MSNQIIIVMGVSGCGKTTIAKMLAQHLSYHFVDADDFHDEQSIALMSKNIGLSEVQRAPWVTRIREYLSAQIEQRRSVVLAFSGLKDRHRQQLAELPCQCQFIWLNPTVDELKRRLSQRTEHFVDDGFLKSQLQDFEVPVNSVSDVSENQLNTCQLQVSEVDTCGDAQTVFAQAKKLIRC